MTKEFTHDFARKWLESWNSGDLDRILEHYSEDFSIQTPMALKLFPESQGTISGKERVREYWEKGLKLIPNLEFELKNLLNGIDSISIYYANTATNTEAVEMMYFDDQKKVNKVIVSYSTV